MNITRADIQRILFNQGVITEDHTVADRNKIIIRYEIWWNSFNKFNISDPNLSPVKLLEKVKWGNRNVPKKNHKDILNCMNNNQTVLLEGSCALKVAGAFCKQLIFKQGMDLFLLSMSNLITQDDPFDRIPSDTVTVLKNDHLSCDSRVLASEEALVVQRLKNISGPKFIIREGSEIGTIERIVSNVLKPTLRFKLSEER